MEMFFYCQSCDAKITVDQLSLLHEGRCPACGALDGFSTSSKSEVDPFEYTTMINDADLLKKTLDGE